MFIFNVNRMESKRNLNCVNWHANISSVFTNSGIFTVSHFVQRNFTFIIIIVIIERMFRVVVCAGVVCDAIHQTSQSKTKPNNKIKNNDYQTGMNDLICLFLDGFVWYLIVVRCLSFSDRLLLRRCAIWRICDFSCVFIVYNKHSFTLQFFFFCLLHSFRNVIWIKTESLLFTLPFTFFLLCLLLRLYDIMRLNLVFHRPTNLFVTRALHGTTMAQFRF